MKTKILALSLVVITALPGCSGLSKMEQRALSGGALGAAGGAAIAAMTGGGALTGALIGAGGGAAVGALTTDKK